MDKPPFIQQDKPQGADKRDDAAYWIGELDKVEHAFSNWEERVWKIVERYRADDDKIEKNRYNILFANVEVMRGIMYQKAPEPKVKRRYLDEDPVALTAAQILERALKYCMDSYDFDGLMKMSVDDRLLGGRGTGRVKYVPSIQDEVVYDEKAIAQYVPWNMFRHGVASRWERVPWIAYGELLSREDMKEQFPSVYKDVSYNYRETGQGEMRKSSDDEANESGKALVWTIWNKSNRRVYVVSPGYDDFITEPMDDPLHLSGFFPCPQPLYGIMTNNSLVPVPDYAQYQDQAREMDRLTNRISNIVDALRVRGIYDSSITALSRLAAAGDNEYIPVDNYANLAEKGGLKNSIFELPIEGLANVAVNLYNQREQVKATIYEISGISDVLRGSSKASETLGAQELKSQYSQSRVSASQKAVAKYARDMLRIKGEIIAEHFQPELLQRMTGLQVDPQLFQAACQLLKSEGTRDFLIDIETDSTLEPDQKAQKQQVTEAMNGLAVVLQSVSPAVEAGAMTKEGAKALLKASLRRYDFGEEVEKAMDMQEPQGPDPEAQKQQAEAQKAQADQAKQQADMQGKMQLAQMGAQKDIQIAQMNIAATRDLEMMKQFGQAGVSEPGTEQPTFQQMIAMFAQAMQQSQDTSAKMLMGLDATIKQVGMMQAQLIAELNKPVIVQRDETGRIVELSRPSPTFQ